MRVLVVEDSAAQRQVLAQMLRGLGHHVAAAHDAEAALARIEHENYDAVIADLGLPGMAGGDLLDILQLRGHGAMRLIGTTAGKHMCVGSHTMLRKPVGKTALQQALAGKTGVGPPPLRARLVDSSRMADLRAELGPDTARRLLMRFVAEADAACARARADAKALHHLAGSAGLFGAIALQTLLVSDADADWTDLWLRTRAALLQAD